MDKTLGDVCNISTGKLDANQAISGGEYPFFTCAEHPDQIDQYAYDCDVVLVAGNNARGNFHVNRFKGKFNAYQRTYILTSKKDCDIDYIYYKLKLELKRLREKSQGSQTKFLTMPILTSIPIGGTSKNEQIVIADILKTIDKKIELNNRINAELESMAKTLYDYWFVQFDFPDANGKPYKSSGGKMVYNEALKREIPEEWGSCVIGDIANFEYGKPLKACDRSGSGFPVYGSSGVVDYHDDSLVAGPGIVVGRKGTVGKINYVFEDFYPIDTTYFVKPKSKDSLIYLNYLLQSMKLEKMNSDSAVPGLNRNSALSLAVIAPPMAIIRLFHSCTCVWFDKQFQLNKEIKQLQQLRDWLLPMLMNGQVTVTTPTKAQSVKA